MLRRVTFRGKEWKKVEVMRYCFRLSAKYCLCFNCFVNTFQVATTTQ